ELGDKIERLDPPGDFEALEVAFAFKERRAVLRFAQSTTKPAKRVVELSISSESGLSPSSQSLATATNSDLVAYLPQPAVVADTLATSEELSQSLSSHRLA